MGGTQRLVGGTRRPPYWLIARVARNRMEILVVEGADCEAMLPVFSSEEDARQFLLARDGGGSGWLPRWTSCGELVSILYGPCAEVERVALDPFPDATSEAIELVGVSRAVFVDTLLGKGRARSVVPHGERKRPAKTAVSGDETAGSRIGGQNLREEKEVVPMDDR